MADVQGSGGGELRRRRRVLGGRQHRHVVRVTPEEEARLLMLAHRYKVTVPKLLVDAALAVEDGRGVRPELSVVERSVVVELFSVVRQLAGVATNVNQLAKHANATSELPSGLEQTLADVRRVAAEAEAAIRRVSGSAAS